MATKIVSPRSPRAPKAPVVEKGDISCITFRRQGRATVRRDYFDVPDEDYGAGWETGRGIAIEMLNSLASSKVRYCNSFMEVMKAACMIAAEPDAPNRNIDKRGAAIGYIRTIEDVVVWGARRADWGGWVRQQQARSAAWEAREAERERQRREDFRRRMEIAQAAKARERAAAR